MFKKTISCLSLFLLLQASATTWAQSGPQKGQNTISLHAGLSSTATTTSINGSIANDSPAAIELLANAAYSYFLSDKFAFSLSTGIEYIRTPNSSTTFNQAAGILLAPEFKYYISITDRLFWVVSAGIGLEFGNYKEDTPSGDTFRTGYSGWLIGIAPAGLEFIVSDKVSIGVGLARFSYVSATMSSNSNELTTSQRIFKLNSTTLSCSFWL
ncbi:MAG: outer membrane beta-barrel protein [Bacteroidales bacterium]|nr:outer membrane beta-barrel protein [Bacteroidales bacterium]